MADKSSNSGRKAKLSAEVDSSGAKKGFQEVKDAAKDMAQGVGQAAQQAGKAVEGIGDKAAPAAQKLTREQANIGAAIQRTIALMEAGSRTSSKYWDALAAQRNVDLSPFRAQLAALDELNAKQNAATKVVAAGTKTLNEYGMSAKQLAFATRQIPAQLQDIFVSLQGGQKVTTVLAQQGSQLSTIFGGMGNAARAVSGYVLGLVNPFTVAAAAVAGLGFAMYETEQKLRSGQGLVVQLQATGRGADFGRAQVEALRKELELLPGVTKDASASIVKEFAATREIGSDVFRQLTLTVADFAAATGTTAPEAAKTLAKAFADPAKGAKDLDKALGILSATQLVTIQRLTDMGDTAGAQRVLLDALQNSVRGLADNAMTPLQKATNDLGNSWSKAMDSLSNSSALQSANDQLAKMLGYVARLIDGVANLSKRGGVGGAAAGSITGAASGYLQYGIPGFFVGQTMGLFAGASGQAQKPQTGGATGSWAPAGPSVDEQVKAVLDATSSYKSEAAAMEELRGKATRLTDTLAKLREEGRGNSVEAKALADRLAGVNEAIDKMANKGAGKVDNSAARELEKQKKLIAELSGLTSDFYEKWDNLAAQAKAGRITGDQLQELQKKLLEQQPFFKEYTKSLAEAEKETQKFLQEQEDAISAFERVRTEGVRSAEQAAAAAEAELAQYGLLKSQVQELALAKLEEARTSAALAGEDVSDIEKRIAAQKRLIAATRGVETRQAADDLEREWQRTADSINSSLTDALLRGFESGKSFAENFRDTLKNSFKTLVLQPTIKAVLSPVSGALAQIGGQIGNAITGGGGSALGAAGGAGSLLNMAGSLGSLTGLGSIGTAFTAGSTSVGVMAGSIAGGGGLLGGAASALGAIGPVGWAALGAAALYSLFGGKGGGPKSEGYYNPFSANPFYSSNSPEVSGAARTATQGIQAQYDAIIQGFGATGGLQFGLGYSTDPKGKAKSMLTVGAGANGQDAFYLNSETGRDQQELTQAIAEQGAKAVLIGLQRANIGGQIADYLASLGDVANLAADQVSAALAKVTKAANERQALEQQLFDLTHTEAERTAAAREKERAALDDTNRALYDQVAALTDAKQAAEAAAAAEAQAAQERQRLAEKAASEQADLQLQLVALTQGDGAAQALQRARQRDALEGSNRALFDQVNALTDAKAAQEALAQAAQQAAAIEEQAAAERQRLAEKAASEQFDLQLKLIGLTQGAQAGLNAQRARERAALEETSRALYDEVNRIGDLDDLINSRRDTLLTAYQRESSELQNVVTQHTQYAQSLRQLRDSLTQSDLPLSKSERTRRTGSAFDAMLSGAIAGNDSALQGLGASAQDYLAAVRQSARSPAEIAAAVVRVQAGLTTAAASEDSRATVAQQQLDSMKEQLTALGLINDSVVSVKDALTQYLDTFGGQAAVDNINAVFLKYLGRSPDGMPDRLRNYAIMGQQGFEQAVAGSPEAAQYAVEQIFEKYLGRAAEDIQSKAAVYMQVGAAAYEDMVSQSPESQLRRLRGYATGGYASGVALVGERGMEVADFQTPARVYTSEQTRGMFASNAELLPAIQQLCKAFGESDENRRREAIAMLQQLSTVASKLKKFDIDGLPPERVTV